MGKQEEREQLERFKRTARELGADESEERFNERLKRIAKTKPKEGRKKSGKAINKKIWR